MPETSDRLKDRLRTDLTTAMKGRDELSTATLRMVLSAVSAEEVAGKEARELSDDEVQAVLRREAKKRREAADAFAELVRISQHTNTKLREVASLLVAEAGPTG